jgi:hypothetical protein
VKPNLVFPLASSYNQRNVLGYAAATAGLDQRKVNCFYEIANNVSSGRTTLTLTKRPGVSLNANTFGVSTQVPYLVVTSPGLSSFDNPWVIVKDGNNLRAVNSSTATTIFTSAVYVPAYADRTLISGTETVYVQFYDGTNLSNPHKTYYSSAIATWTEITDATYTAIAHRGKHEQMDGYLFAMGGDNKIHNSRLNSLADWDGDFISKSVQQDFSFGLARYKGLILAFGEETCEFFYNAGNAAGSPLSRLADRFARVGLGQMARNGGGRTDYYTYIGNNLFFVGKPALSAYVNSLMVYTGSGFEKVSGDYEDKLLNNSSVYSVNKVAFGGQVGVGIQMTAPGEATQRWLMYFPTTKSWFEWESALFSPANNGQWFAGVTNKDKLYQFDINNNWQDAGNNYTFSTQFLLPGDTGEWRTMHNCGVVADTASTTLAVSFDDNEDGSFSSGRSIRMDAGRKAVDQCGTFRTRHVRLSNTSSSPIRLHQFYAAVV